MKSLDVSLGLLIAAIVVGVIGVLNGEAYAKDPWHIPLLVSLLIAARQTA